jgi:MerR HTH family regulatory protein
VVPEEELLRRMARASGLRRTEVRRLVQLDVVVTGEEPIGPAVLRRLRRARRLRRDLGLSLDAVAIILRLVDRIEALEGRQTSGPVPRVLDDRQR